MAAEKGADKDTKEDKENAEMIDTSNNEAKQKADIENEEVDDEPDSAFEYKLVGVLIHMGTPMAGHYLSLINVHDLEVNGSEPCWEKVEDQKWLEYNDDVVKTFNFGDLEEHAFGETANKNKNNYTNSNMCWDNQPPEKNKNAYMLIYEKREKSQFKINISAEIVE
jgi:hypothetical protein